MTMLPIISSPMPLSVSLTYAISTCSLTFPIRADNQPQITEAIKKVLQEDYNYDSTVRTSPYLTSVVSCANPSSDHRILCTHCIALSRNAFSSKMKETSSSIKTIRDKHKEFWQTI